MHPYCSSNYLGNAWPFPLPFECLDQFDKLEEKRERGILVGINIFLLGLILLFHRASDWTSYSKSLSLRANVQRIALPAQGCGEDEGKTWRAVLRWYQLAIRVFRRRPLKLTSLINCHRLRHRRVNQRS